MALSCAPGGFSLGLPLVVDAVKIDPNGSFSTKTSQQGVIGVDNYPATFTATFEGQFKGVTSSGAPEASGSYLETIAFSNGGTKGSCSTKGQSWSATRDSQPAQSSGVGASGSYSGGESQNGDPLSFSVSAARTQLVNLDVSVASLGCSPGDGGIGTAIKLNSLALSSAGSFSTAYVQHSTVNGVAETFDITFEGHFHGVNSSDDSRAAGSYLVTGTYTRSGTEYSCSSNKQWWHATHTGS